MSRRSPYHRDDDSYRSDYSDRRYDHREGGDRASNGSPPPPPPPPSDSYKSNNRDIGESGGVGGGNLHVTNFGPSTTMEDVQELFAPFVKVDEVVMRCNENGKFAEVYTSDSKNANRAREAMHGKAMLGGVPVFISRATSSNVTTGSRPATRQNSYHDQGGGGGGGADDYGRDRRYGYDHRRENDSYHRDDSYQGGEYRGGDSPRGERRRSHSPADDGSYNSQNSYQGRRGSSRRGEDDGRGAGDKYYRRDRSIDRQSPDDERDRQYNIQNDDMQDDGNLHITHFGPGTTREDIEALFAPYVKVDEVVMRSNEKGDYAFVNTRDPINAQIASRALSGKAMLRGMPVWISRATRKGNSAPPSARESYRDYRPSDSFGAGSGSDQPYQPRASESEQFLHPQGAGNLHITHFGDSTTQEDIERLFEPFVKVDRVVMRSNEKGAFAFVDTSDPDNAAKAKEALSGKAMLGGLPVWIAWAGRATRKRPAPPQSSVEVEHRAGGGDPMGPLPQPTTDLHPKGAGNLHMVNFGPRTCKEDIERLISPYVKVDRVVMKTSERGPFAFIDTSDPPNALKAKETLSGRVKLDGKVVWISWAGRATQRKPPPPSEETGNLHITHFGPNTTKEDIEKLFSTYVDVDEVVMRSNEKGDYAFVNTSDPLKAQVAREALNGKATLDGLVVWVNRNTKKVTPSFGSGGFPRKHEADSPPIGESPNKRFAPSY